jgi:hypothetical protein
MAIDMTDNYSFADVLRMVDRHVSRNVITDFAADICNLAYSKIWHRYDWRESLATLPPFYLIPNEQDIGPPFYSVPSDFAGLRKADLVYVAADPPTRKPLTVIKDLNLTHARWLPHSISYNPDTRSFRVFSRVTLNMGTPNWQIEGTYKKLATRITPTTLTTPLPTKDDLLHMWIEGIKWAAFSLAGDAKAGSVQKQDGSTILTGQLAVFYQAMDSMAANEGLELGDNYIHPGEPLVSGMYGNTFSIYTGFGGY